MIDLSKSLEKQFQLKTVFSASNILNEDESNNVSSVFTLGNQANKISDFVMKTDRMSKNNELNIKDEEDQQKDEEEEEEVYSNTNMRGGIVDFSVCNMKNINLLKSNETIVENEEILTIGNIEEAMPESKIENNLLMNNSVILREKRIIAPQRPIRKKIKSMYAMMKFTRIIIKFRNFLKRKKHIKRVIFPQNQIIYKMNKSLVPIYKIVKIQNKIRQIINRKRLKMNDILNRTNRDNLNNFIRIIDRVCARKPFNNLKIYSKKLEFKAKLKRVLLNKTLSYYFTRLRFLGKLYKIIRNKINQINENQTIKCLFLWKRNALLDKCNKVNNIFNI